MPTLSEIVTDAAARKRVVEEGVRVVEAEVADKGGLTGMAIKAGFAVVKKLRPDFVGVALDHLMPEFAKKIDPIWAACKASPTPKATFIARGAEVADALLQITDAKSKNAAGPAKATYERLRPEAAKHVQAAMPRLAEFVAKFA